MFGLFQDKESQEFARKLASELDTRVPPAIVKSATGAESGYARARQHIESRGRDFTRTHKVSVLKQIALSRTLQSELASRGYEGDFIKDMTVTLARAMRERSK